MKTVLFVCVHNAGRSQMAEAFFNQVAQERALDAQALSAGTEPLDSVHPEVVAAMREVGIGLSRKKPKLLTNEMVKRADRVITMGCSADASACPAILFKEVEDWSLDDLKGQPLQRVREIRDRIRDRVLRLIERMSEAKA